MKEQTRNTGAPQYVRQMLTSMKGEINNNTIIVGDFNTPLTPMDRSTKRSPVLRWAYAPLQLCHGPSGGGGRGRSRAGLTHCSQG